MDEDRTRDAGRALFDTVCHEWSELPDGSRPRLYVFEESLGSFGAEPAFSGDVDMSNPGSRARCSPNLPGGRATSPRSLLGVEIVGWLTAGVLVLLAASAAVGTRMSGLDHPVRHAVTAVEVLVVVFVVADLGLVLRADPADRPGNMLTHVGYAVAAVGLLPMLAQRRPPPDDPDAEVEPASLWVVAIALLAVAVCVVRLVQTR